MIRLVLALLSILTLACFEAGLESLPAQAAANSISVDQTCVAGKASVTFKWQGNDPAAQHQWLDLTTVDNGWAGGTFISAGPLDASADSYTWDGLTPARLHMARVNQQSADGSWDASVTFRFTTSCGAAPPPIASPAPGSTPSFVLLGVSDHTGSNNSPPDDIVPPGGTLKGCNIQTIYSWTKISNVQPPKQLSIGWYQNGSLVSTPSNRLPVELTRPSTTLTRALTAFGNHFPTSSFEYKISTADDGLVLDESFKIDASC